MPGSFNRTAQALRASYLAPLTRNVAAGWRWWLAEFKGLLPENLRRIIETGNQQLIVAAVGDEFLIQHGSANQMQELGRIRSAADDITVLTVPDDFRQTILLLPRDKVLSRPLTLPLAAEENLREVLSFEMDSQTPFTADQVYYDHFVTGRSPRSKTLSVQLFVAPRDIVDDSLTTLAANGIYPDVVAANAGDNPDGRTINLLPADTQRNRGITVQRMNLALAALASLLIIAALALPLLQKNTTIRSLEAEISEAAIGAQASNQLRQEVENLIAGSIYLVQKKRTEPTMTQLLDDMTRIIPDDTWVNRVDFSDGEIQLQGQSGAAAGLIGLIEASPTFHNARFRSPVTQIARTSQERFHLSADTVQRPAE